MPPPKSGASSARPATTGQSFYLTDARLLDSIFTFNGALFAEHLPACPAAPYPCLFLRRGTAVGRHGRVWRVHLRAVSRWHCPERWRGESDHHRSSVVFERSRLSDCGDGLRLGPAVLGIRTQRSVARR